MLDVAEVLAVDLQRQGHVAAEDDPVDVVEHVEPLHADGAARQVEQQARHAERAHGDGGNDVEPEVERRAARHPQRHPPA